MADTTKIPSVLFIVLIVSLMSKVNTEETSSEPPDSMTETSGNTTTATSTESSTATSTKGATATSMEGTTATSAEGTAPAQSKPATSTEDTTSTSAESTAATSTNDTSKTISVTSVTTTYPPPTECGDPGKLPNAIVENKNWTTYQSWATYKCNAGYDLTGDPNRTCQANGNWSEKAFNCTLKDCGEPGTLSNEIVEKKNGTTYQSWATYKCYTGYNLTGDPNRTCQDDGKWSEKAFSCTLKDCFEPGKLPNANMTHQNGTTYRSWATYKCYTGYNLTGDPNRTCQDNGKWSEKAFNCTLKDCGEPGNLPNANVTHQNGTTYQSWATYKCYTGYNLTGDPNRTCQDDGKWSEKAFNCILKDCGEPGKLQNANVTHQNGTTYQSLATYKCNAGYDLTGDPNRTCKANGKWSEKAFNCTLKVTQINETCHTDEQCSAAIPDASCIESTCQCNRSRFYIDGKCVIRPTLPDQMFKFTFIGLYGFSVDWKDLALTDNENVRLTLDPPKDGGDPIPEHFETTYCPVTGLLSGTNYTVYLHIVKNKVPSYDAQILSQYTKPEDPILDGSNISDIYEHNFTVKLISDPKRPCENYTLTISGLGVNTTEVNISRQVHITSYSFKNLLGGVNYTVIIFAVAGEFTSSGSKTLSSFTRPPKVSDVVISKQHNASLELSVNYTGEGKQHISYCIYVKSPITKTALQSKDIMCKCCKDNSDDIYSVFCTSNSKYAISGLTPGTNYSLEIYSCIDGLKSELPYFISAATRPRDPDVIISEVGETSMRVECKFEANDSTTGIQLNISEPYNNNIIIERNGSLPLEHLFEKLTAGTSYVILAYSFFGDLRSETPVTLHQFTRPLQTNVTEIKKYEKSLKLVVSSSVYFNMLQVIVTQDGKEIQDLTHEVIDSSVELRNLTSGTNYGLTLITLIDDLKSLQMTDTSSFTKPGPPQQVSFPDEGVHENSIQVNISPPSEGGYDDFCLVLRNADGNKTVNSTCVTAVNTANKVTYSELSAGVKYTVSVITRWQNETSTVFSNSQRTRPDPPVKVIVSNIKSNSLTINFTKKWDAYSFVFAPSLDNSDINITVTEIPWTIHNLTTGTKYNISIYSVEENIPSERSTTKITYTRPGNVTSVSGVPDKTTESSLTIQWKNPVGHFDLFNISALCKSPNKDSNRSKTVYAKTNLTMAHLEPLDPGTTCTVSITVVISNVDTDNKVLEGDQISQTINISTKETAPQEVIFVEDTVVDARSLYVQWKKPNNPNGIVRNYRIMIIDLFHNCSKVKTFVEEESIPDTYSCTDVKSNTYEACTTDEHITPSELVAEPISANISGLHPYRNYSVNIQAYTRCWGDTKKLIDQTDEAAPRLAPQVNVLETFANSINVSWRHLDFEDRNGLITEYKIRYKYNDKNCSDTQVENNIWKERTNINSDLTSLIIGGLQPFWYYEFSISASTSAGEGPSSSCNYTTCRVRTSEYIPGNIDSDTVSFTKTDTNSIALTWRKPCRPNGIITGYSYKISNLDTLKSWDENTVGNVTKYTISDLLPYRNYSVQLAASTKVGKGNFTLRRTVTTEIAKPFKPNTPNLTAVSSSSFRVTWLQLPQSKYTGPTNYTVHATDLDDVSVKSSCKTQGFNSTSCVITGLRPYWKYSVIVIAGTEVDNSEISDTQNGTTKQDTPGPVSFVLLSAENDVHKERSINITWEAPSKWNLNGVIIKYHIICTNIKDGTNACSNSTSANIQFYQFRNMPPGTYNITVFAETVVGPGIRLSNTTSIKAGAPIKLVNETSGNLLMKPSPLKVSDEERQISVQLPLHDLLCNSRNGLPVRWGVVVVQDGNQNDVPFIGTLKEFQDTRLSVYSRWSHIKDDDSIAEYIATPTNWRPGCSPQVNGNRQKRYADTDSKTGHENFVVGSQGECSGVPDNQYCNGELQPGRSYRVKVFVCTSEGCTETRYSNPISTDLDLTVPIAAGASSAIFVLVIVFVVVFILRRKQAMCFAKDPERTTPTHRPGDDIHLDKTELTKKNSFRPWPIKLSDFPDTVENMHKDTDLIFADAYKLLKEKSPNHPMTAAEQQCCRPKNRYTNILPFDHSRVKLRPSDDMEGSDYINANYIPGYTSRREYIATQGAMQATFDDFWRMIWEQNVDTIVMLTKLMEKGRHKCDKYWPDLGEPVFYGDLVVSLQSESNLSDYTIKIFEVKMKEERKMVRHFSYLKWPDMGCPDTPELLLEFVKAVRQYTNQEKRTTSGPTVVHCSAGVGRTGTFIAVDYLLQHIRDHDEVDIFSFVLEMRNHRLNMVQTEDQYVYIHECLKAFISTDEEEEDEADDEHLYVNTSFGAQEENVYENSGYQKD